MKIGVLGSGGMLGQAVCRFFESRQLPYFRFDDVFSVEKSKWYLENLKSHSFDMIINCIGAIPQKKSTAKKYFELNIALPYYLSHLSNTFLIHPSTDCVFNHDLKPIDGFPTSACEFDATDIYGFSKGVGDFFINEANSVVVRSSIIGLTKNSRSLGLVDWAVKMRGKEVKGYKNHFWNGVTTDAWARWVYENIILNYKFNKSIVHIGATDWVTKCDLLHLINDVFDLKLKIVEVQLEGTSDRRLSLDFELTDVYSMLCDMREFWHE